MRAFTCRETLSLFSNIMFGPFSILRLSTSGEEIFHIHHQERKLKFYYGNSIKLKILKFFIICVSGKTFLPHYSPWRIPTTSNIRIQVTLGLSSTSLLALVEAVGDGDLRFHFKRLNFVPRLEVRPSSR